MTERKGRRRKSVRREWTPFPKVILNFRGRFFVFCWFPSFTVKNICFESIWNRRSVFEYMNSICLSRVLLFLNHKKSSPTGSQLRKKRDSLSFIISWIRKWRQMFLRKVIRPDAHPDLEAERSWRRIQGSTWSLGTCNLRNDSQRLSCLSHVSRAGS